uniref:Uncharacterized protein n=1 Tax=Kalanchoe fedtschenkoi TaxID=63787 RepID=A0A7N0T9H3_KALFE
MNLQPPSSIQCLTSEWFLRQNRRSEAGMMRILSFALGVWEIWKQRCVAMFDSRDVEVPDEVVRWRITSLLRIRMDNFKPKFAASTTDLDILKRFGVVGKLIAARRLDQILWLPSSIGSTINIACLQNVGAAILRSPDGSLIIALAMKLSPYAELDGLPTLLKSLIARSDNSGSNLPTEIQWDTTIASASLAWSIRPMKHMRSKMIPKRCNGAVHDLLSKVVARGEDLANPLWLSPSDLPLSTALIIEHDKSNLPNSS